MLAEQHRAHMLIGAAEPVLWTARRVAAKVAILAHRSANAWDPPGTAKWENITEYTMSYQADQFGLYLALAIHGGVSVDFVDEDALLNSTTMAVYSVLFITEPNVPKAAMRALGDWLGGDSGGDTTGAGKQKKKLVLSAGAAIADEYNSTDSFMQDLAGSHLTPLPRRLLKEVRQVPGPSPLPFAAYGHIGEDGNAQPFAAYGGASAFLDHPLPETATVLARFDDHSAAAVENTVGNSGSGSIVQLAWQPGFSYCECGISFRAHSK
jgi:hypothetical protein